MTVLGFFFSRQEHYLEWAKKPPYSFLASNKMQEMRAAAFQSLV